MISPLLPNHPSGEPPIEWDLLLIRGLPGSGKTNYARSLRHRLERDGAQPVFHFEMDDWFTSPITGEYVFCERELASAYNHCEVRTRSTFERYQYAATRPKVIVANPFIRRSELAPYLRIARDYRRIAVEVICVDEDQPAQTKPPGLIEQMQQAFQI